MRTSRFLGVVGVIVLSGGLLARQDPAPASAPQNPQAPAAGGVQPQAPADPGRGAGRGPGGPGARAGGGGGRGRGVAIQPGEECPPNMTETRPNMCQAPEFPTPNILDYRPDSTLVTAEHLVPKAKFPAIDYHGHPGGNYLNSAEGVAQLMTILDSLNIRVMMSADVMSGQRLQQTAAVIAGTPYKDRIRILTGINFQGVGPGWAEKAIAQLEADVKAGAVGVGEIMKGFGLNTRKPDGSRLKLDDPELDPIWEACARLNLPVFIHTADPAEFFQPIDMKNERWLELSLFGDRRYQAEQYPRFEDLMAERDRLFKKHPKTKFIAAHFGWHANDLGRLSKMFDEMPNVSTEMGAILYDLGRQPRAAREFLIKYQDRVLFGKDSFQPEEYPTYWRVLETNDEYFDYYRNYHAFWKMYGLGLPDAVLKKIYFANALRLTPGIPQTGWPR